MSPISVRNVWGRDLCPPIFPKLEGNPHGGREACVVGSLCAACLGCYMEPSLLMLGWKACRSHVSQPPPPQDRKGKVPEETFTTTTIREPPEDYQPAQGVFHNRIPPRCMSPFWESVMVGGKEEKGKRSTNPRNGCGERERECQRPSENVACYQERQIGRKLSVTLPRTLD